MTVQVISTVQSKGGAGKSTIVRCIAAFLANDNAKVIIIDTDTQKSCEMWVLKKEIGVDVIYLADDEKLAATVTKLKESYDVILIDTAGYKSSMALHAILLSDLVLIPTKASEPDAIGALTAWQHVKSLSHHKADEIKSYIVYTDIDKTASITQTVKDEILRNGAPMIDTALWHRTGFKEMNTTGGLPVGSALIALREFVAELQMKKLLNWYQEA